VKTKAFAPETANLFKKIEKPLTIAASKTSIVALRSVMF